MVEEKPRKKPDPTRSRATLLEDGSEDHSNTGGPLASSFRVEQRESLGDRVRELIRSEKLAMDALHAGYETFEDADDFDVEDDTFDPSTPYEEVFEGSIAEDVTTRYNEQQKQLRETKADKLKVLLAGMDPDELKKALSELPTPGNLEPVVEDK